MFLIDLEDASSGFSSGFLRWANRLRIARFRRGDHFGDQDVPLDQAVRQLIKGQTGRFPQGPIKLLTNLSCMGYCFNPISVYYCFAPSGGELEWVVLEVTNTPWGDRHCYVLDAARPASRGRGWSFTFGKELHVSPFIPMEMQYDCWVGQPGERLGLAIHVHKGAQPVLETSLALKRRPLDGPELFRCLVRHPAMAAEVTAKIHWQALKLWCKRVPLFSHPDHEDTGEAETS